MVFGGAFMVLGGSVYGFEGRAFMVLGGAFMVLGGGLYGFLRGG